MSHCCRCVALAALFAAAFATSCASRGGGGGGGVDVEQFPSAGDVAAIASRPPPSTVDRTASATSTWTFLGPFDDSFGDVPVDSVSAVEQVWVDAIGKQRLTRSGRCAARELAQFVVEKGLGTWPDQRWRSFVSARCGSAALARPAGARSFTGFGSATDQALLQQFKQPVIEDLGNVKGDIGIAYARKGDLAVAVIVELEPQVRIQPTSMKAVQGRVEVRGTLVDGDDAELVYASVNQGETEVAPCERDVYVRLPTSILHCPVSATDHVAGIDISVRRRGRFLANGAGSVMALPGAAEPTVWSASVWGEASPLPADEAALAQVFFERANGVRVAGKLPVLLFADGQSKTAAKLAPHYFDRPSADLADEIALGLLAGWDLQQPVRDGYFASFSVAGSTLDEVVGAALDSPAARSVLMSKAAGIIALGVVRGPDGVGLLVTTWEPFEVVAPAVTQSRVFEALKAERARRGLGPLGEVGMEKEYAAASVRLQNGEPERVVLDDLLNATVKTMQRGFRGWSVESSNPERIAWPDELLTKNPTYIAVSAGMRRYKNSPWATTVVIIVAFVDDQGVKTALHQTAPQ